MSKTVQLLLTETVETLGIVGDVVNVRMGYARNYLLPRELATEPSEEKIQALAAKRAEAERERAQKRAEREQMVEKLEGHEVTIEKSCNDQGLLYASVTQHEIAEALNEEGFSIRPRDVRISGTIKRIDSYEVLIKPEQDLEATIKLWVVADRELNLDTEPEVEVDEEGEMIHPAPEESAGESAAGESGAAQPVDETKPATE